MAYPFIGDRNPLIIIDPGHGGVDGGGGTNKYWKEKDLVLKISLYQYGRFREFGIPVALTRNKDIYLSPEKRTSIVKASGATYCLSNHINAGGGDGAEFIHSIYADGKLEDMMADEIKKVGQNVRRVFTRTYTSNGKKYDYYFMHRDTGKVITTIAEYGFADSKRDDVEQLKNDWQEYAEAIVKAYCRYLGIKYVAPKSEQPKPTPKPKPKEENDMLEKAIVINSFADFPNAEVLANKLNAPIYMRSTAEKQEVAKEVVVIGGSKSGIKGKVTLLSGADRYETAAEVKKYLK